MLKLSRRCIAALLFAGCLASLAPLAARGDAVITSEAVASGLTSPLFATSPTGDGRLFIVERAGRIRILLGGTVLQAPFLDIRQQVATAGEFGLLGLAFAPDYPRTGLFYVYYANLAGEMVLARFGVGDDPDRADAASEEILLVVEQTAANHNGGTIAFGADGQLYLALGDGGFGNDPFERSQDPQSLLGKMLRLDVSGGPGSLPAIPPDNPFVDDPGVLDEIWSFGWRNPYRWSFDRGTGDLWVGDVGQARIEEVDFEPADDPGGRNYGWDVMEGTLCNPNDPAPTPPCNDPSLTLPVLEYSHVFGLCSITGGYVYRGPFPDIQGLYFFGDFCRGVIWSFEPAGRVLRLRTLELAPAAGQRFALVGFGENGSGELHIVLRSGTVHRIRSPDPACSDGFDNDGDGLSDADDPACADPAQDGELPRNDLRLDVRPGSLNPMSQGVVPVSLLASDRYDLTRADPDTLAFGPGLAPRAHPQGPHLEDLDGDGIEDWTLHFQMQASGLVADHTQACVRIEIARVPFEACDAVTIPPGDGTENANGSGEAAASAATQAPASPDAPSAPDILRYVEPTEDCTAWDDCGWVWVAPVELSSENGMDDAVEVPASSPPASLVLGLALLAGGWARLAAGSARRGSPRPQVPGPESG